MMRFSLISAFLLVTVLTGARTESCPESCKCTASTMDCRNGDKQDGLTAPPEGYWPNVLNLLLPQNSIANLYEHSFTGFPNVNQLVLEENELTELDLAVFSGLNNLGHLFLGGNRIHTVKWSASAGPLTSKSLYLYLDKNSLTYLDPDLFATAIPNLKILDLQINPLTLPQGKSFLNHPQVGILAMSDCDGTNLNSETFKGLPKLGEVHLNRMGIKNITGVFQNMKLVQVHLGANSITELLPGTFNPNRLIQILYLRDNPLQKLDLAAINDAMYGSTYSSINLDDTPMACNCQYDSVYWWGEGRGITVSGNCNGVYNCGFAKILR